MKRTDKRAEADIEKALNDDGWTVLYRMPLAPDWVFWHIEKPSKTQGDIECNFDIAGPLLRNPDLPTTIVKGVNDWYDFLDRGDLTASS